MHRFLRNLALVALVLPVPAGAADVTAGDLTITGAWTRQAPPGARVGGGYLTVANAGSRPDRLLAGRAGFADRVEIHAMSVTDGVMRMAPVDGGLAIAPGETVTLAPGSFHLMFMGLNDAPEAGETVSVTLTFERAGDVVVEMPVAPIGASGAPGHSNMSHGGAGKTDE